MKFKTLLCLTLLSFSQLALGQTDVSAEFESKMQILRESFKEEVHPLLRKSCAKCHSEKKAPIEGGRRHSQSNSKLAFDVFTTYLDIVDIEESRILTVLKREYHPGKREPKLNKDISGKDDVSAAIRKYLQENSETFKEVTLLYQKKVEKEESEIRSLCEGEKLKFFNENLKPYILKDSKNKNCISATGRIDLERLSISPIFKDVPKNKENFFKELESWVSKEEKIDSTKIKKISAGDAHTLILTDKGQVYSFGYNRAGQLGRETRNGMDPILGRINLSEDIKVVDISAGGEHSLILTNKGQVYSFGNNSFGLLGRVTEDYSDSTPRPINLSEDIKIVDISAGGSHSLILTDKGQVYSFGDNQDGQLGRSTEGDYSSTTPGLISLSKDIKIVGISAGVFHSLILTDSGQVYSFGGNQDGQLGRVTGNTDSTPRPINLSEDIKVVDISAGGRHSLILTDKGQVYSFGSNVYAQLGRVTGNTDSTPRPINLSEDIKIVDISAGGGHSLILTDSGQVYSFGFNANGQLGRKTRNTDLIPRPINLSEDIKVVDISAGVFHSLILTDQGQVYSFGANENGLLGLSQFVYGEQSIKIMRLNE